MGGGKKKICDDANLRVLNVRVDCPIKKKKELIFYFKKYMCIHIFFHYWFKYLPPPRKTIKMIKINNFAHILTYFIYCIE